MMRSEALDLPSAKVPFEFKGKQYHTTKRLLLSTSIQFENTTVRILNAHLQAYFMLQTNSDIHRQQRDTIESLLRSANGPAVLAGDMNSAPTEGLVNQFRSAGFHTAQNSLPTWKRRDYTLDHIFINGQLELTQPVEIIPTHAADHHALLARLKVRA